PCPGSTAGARRGPLVLDGRRTQTPTDQHDPRRTDRELPPIPRLRIITRVVSIDPVVVRYRREQPCSNSIPATVTMTGATLRCRGRSYVQSLDVIANPTIPATVATCVTAIGTLANAITILGMSSSAGSNCPAGSNGRSRWMAITGTNSTATKAGRWQPSTRFGWWPNAICATAATSRLIHASLTSVTCD